MARLNPKYGRGVSRGLGLRGVGSQVAGPCVPAPGSGVRAMGAGASAAELGVRAMGAGALSLAAAALLASSLAVPAAHAETYATTPIGTGQESAAAIESATKDYNEARTSYVQSGAKVFALQKHSEVLAGLLPAQQERSDEAARQLYKLQGEHYSLIEMLLESDSLDTFIMKSEYLDRITRANENEIARTNALQEQVAESQSRVEAARADAVSQLQAASDKLEAAYAERMEKQRLGIATAEAQAASLGGAISVGRDGAGNAQPEDFNIAASDDASPLNDGANWHATEEEFVAEWAPRLDAYLAGSPLAGQGVNFAKSAYKYCIDPRWSAAISNTESSKGRVCIRPHNAWGWGAADSDPYNLASEWDSWESAIDTHARGLANGYGYTISMTGAQAYCPYTWQSWYNNTLGEMARI